MVPGEGIEPSHLAVHDFESCASTSSATPALVAYSTLSFLKNPQITVNINLYLFLPAFFMENPQSPELQQKKILDGALTGLEDQMRKRGFDPEDQRDRRLFIDAIADEMSDRALNRIT
jgi:hypothetical protein